MAESSSMTSNGNRWTVDGALLYESTDQALLRIVHSLGIVKNLWVLNPRLCLQKWCYHEGIPWFHLVEGLPGEYWRWPSRTILPSLIVIRYRPDFPCAMSKVQTKLEPLLDFCEHETLPMVLDRQSMPPFLCQELDPWLTHMATFFPLMQLYPISAGGMTYGALRGSSKWMEVLRGSRPLLQEGIV